MTADEFFRELTPHNRDVLKNLIFTEQFLYSSVAEEVVRSNIRNRLNMDVFNGILVAVVWIIRYILQGELDLAEQLKEILIKGSYISVEDLKIITKTFTSEYSSELAVALEAYTDGEED